MGALAMTTEPQAGSVTMLRQPGTPPAGAEAPKTATPEPAVPPAATDPAVAAQAMSASIPSPGLLQKVARSKALWGGVAAVALLGIGATAVHVASSPKPVTHAAPAAQTAVVSGADANSSGITPPDLGAPPAAAKQATAPAASAVRVTPANTGATSATTAPVATLSAPTTQPVEAPSAQTAPEETAPDTRTDQPATRSATSGEDQLFMEMSRQLTEMTNRIDTLEQKLDASQHALHDQIVSGLGTVGGRLDELRHREDTLEAGQVARPATPAAPTAAETAAAQTAPRKATEAPSPRHTHAESAPAERPVARPHYTVQAGAPDIAILQNPQGLPVRVQPGSMLDGWGTVTAVTQSGSSWLVHTEHGTIR